MSTVIDRGVADRGLGDRGEAAREALLATVFAAHPVQVTIVSAPDYCGRWFENEPATPQGSFHLIDRGRCWVRSASLAAPLLLQAGDLIVFTRGAAHTLHGWLDHEPEPAAEQYSTLVCGEFHFSSETRNPLLTALPDAFVVRAADGGSAFRELAQLLSDCARRRLPGQQAILDKLADSLFVMAVCTYAAQSAGHRGLLAALADPRLAKALSAMHLAPGKPWRVDTLAQVAGMSRTAFSLEFTRVLDVSPFQYLTEWRIAEARRLLRDRRLSVAAVAEQLGYQSEAAFRRTFKRVEGVGPGQLRRAPNERA